MHNTPSALGSASCLGIGNCIGTDVGMYTDEDEDEEMNPGGLEVTSVPSFEISELRVDSRPMTRIGSRPSSIRKIVLFPDPVKRLKLTVK